MSVRTVKVSNVSIEATEREIKEFFSFSGDIDYLEMNSEDEHIQTAHVTFKDPKGAETAVLLSGATIADKTVNISLDPDYQLPPDALITPTDCQDPENKTEAALKKAEDVVSSMLAKGFLLGKDAVNKAKELDEKHQLTSTASAKVKEVDQKIGLTEKISIGTAIVNDKVKEVDAKYQVSEKTKSALAVAEQKVSSAGSAVMKNRYVLTGATWVTGAFNKVAKAAGEVGQKAQEKMVLAEEEQKSRELNETDLPKDIATAPNEVESEPSKVVADTAPIKPESPKAVVPEPSQPPLGAPKHETEPEKI